MRRRAAVVLLAVVAIIVGLAQSALAAYSVSPVGPAWVPDGAVDAVLVSGSTVYVGGEFTGHYAALSADTGALQWLGNADGSVRALALAGDGTHLLIGGAFNTVGGTTHRKLASVNLSDGTVNTTYKAAAGGTVRDIVVVGGTEYFAGAFTSHGGMTQQGLGAVDTVAGKAVTSFTPTANGTVYALATDGTRLFFGGGFTTVNGATRNQLAAVTLAGGLDTWAPAKACSGSSLFWDLTLGGSRVYAVGRNCASIYAVDTTTGKAVFRTTANGDSQAVTLAPDGLLYVGGHFNSVTVGGVTTSRTIVAAYNVTGTTPVLQPFSARFVTTYPGVWAIAGTSTRLYVGGYYTASGPKVNGADVRPYLTFFPSV